MSRRKINIGIAILFTVLLGLNSNAQSLDSLLKMAVDNNPELKALQLEYEAAIEKKDQVSQLPNPEIGAGVPILRPETRLGPQIVMVGAKQMFPWFGTLKSKESVTIAMAKVKYERIAALKLDIFQTIKSAYYNLCLIDRKVAIVNENLSITKTMESISLSKVESGQGRLSNVLQIQLRIEKHLHDIELLEIGKLKHYASINALINQEIATPIIVQDSYSEPVDISLNLESYRTKIKEHHPLILQMNSMIEASQLKQEVNENMGKPMFGVGLDYALVGERTDMNPPNNGRDILVPKVMVSIPLYRKKYVAKNKEEDLLQQSLEFRKETMEDKMIGRLQSYQVAYDQALIHIDFVEKQAETTKQTYDLILAQYSANGKGFTDLLLLEKALVKYKLELETTILNTYQIQANIDRLTDF